MRMRFFLSILISLTVVFGWTNKRLFAAAQADTVYHSGFFEEDKNDDWNGDGQLDGTDRFGGIPGDGILHWPAGIHVSTTPYGDYQMDTGRTLLIDPGSVVTFGISLGSRSVLKANQVSFHAMPGHGEVTLLYGNQVKLDFHGCVFDSLSSIRAGVGSKAAEIILDNCDVTKKMLSSNYMPLDISSEKFVVVGGRMELLYGAIIAADEVSVTGTKFYFYYPLVTSWNFGGMFTCPFEDLAHLWKKAFFIQYPRRVSIEKCRFEGEGGFALAIEDTSGGEVYINHCSFVNAAVGLWVSNELLKWSDFTWNYWGGARGPHIFTFEKAGSGFDFNQTRSADGVILGVHTSPDPNYAVSFDPYMSTDPNDEDADSDLDGLINSQEGVWGTDRYNPDTDGDGILDGTEVLNGTNPLDPFDPGYKKPELTRSDSLLQDEAASDALNALSEQAVDTLRQRLQNASPEEKAELFRQVFNQIAAQGILSALASAFGDNTQLLNWLNSGQDPNWLVNTQLDGLIQTDYDSAAFAARMNQLVANPPDTLNTFLRQKKCPSLSADFQLSKEQNGLAVYKAPGQNKAGVLFTRKDVRDNPPLIGEQEKGAINAMEGVGKLIEKVDKTGIISKVYSTDLITGTLKAGIKNVTKFISAQGQLYRVRKENTTYIPNPPPPQTDLLIVKDRVITVQGVGQIGTVLEDVDGQGKYIVVSGKVFNKDSRNWSWFRRSWTSRFVGGIPDQIIPLVPVDQAKGIYKVDTSKIPPTIGGQHPLQKRAVQDTTETFFALSDPDSDGVAEILLLDSNGNRKFDTFLYAASGDSLGYTLVKVDSNEDGKIDLVLSDLDADGIPDAVDLNADGTYDAFDTNGDGVLDRIDVDFDGKFDALDVNLDGQLDLFFLAGSENLGVPGAKSVSPSHFALQPVYPNPATGGRPLTTVYQLAYPGNVEIVLFDVLGREVARWTQGRQPTGRYQFHWSDKVFDSRTVPAGIYFLRLQVKGKHPFLAVQKFAVIR